MEIGETIKKGLEIVPVSRMDEVLARAMTRKPDRVGRNHDHHSGRARGGPGRGGSRDAHRALNDRDTGAAEITTVPGVGAVLRRDSQ